MYLNEVAIDKVLRLLPSRQEQQAEIAVGQRLFFFGAVPAAGEGSQSERDLQVCMELVDEARLRSYRTHALQRSARPRSGKYRRNKPYKPSAYLQRGARGAEHPERVVRGPLPSRAS